MRRPYGAALLLVVFMLCWSVAAAEESCITCHRGVSPGQVQDWESSRHAKIGISCSACHGDAHSSSDDVNLVSLPDEQVCAACHEEQFGQFTSGKHNFGWTTLNALPVTHLEPDILIEGGRGCGGCHNMGIKTAEQKAD